MKISLCNEWEYSPAWSEAFAAGGGEAEAVRLPHTSGEVPLHYALPEHYERVCGYRRRLRIPAEYADRRLFLQFDGAGHIATVYLNGEELTTHRCGYTAFRTEITGKAHPGGEDLLTVRLDATENPAVPPFGHVVDYLTYGGLYREVWLDVRGRSCIDDLYVTTPLLTQARVELSVSGEGGPVRVSVLDREGRVCASETHNDNIIYVNYTHARPWDLDDPALYVCRAELLSPEGKVVDELETTFGFRTTEWRKEGFFLNGKKVFLRGLNRHQSYPYIGYAAPESLQREDARILKEELCCNAVRTSHYPQSRYFVDECDRLGLLVFTEIPGWQHIGDAAWREQAVENTREMVLQYRNHPSVVLWGVRINESRDHDELYRRTNAVAHELDPCRATSGERFIHTSHLLEDVYAYNDFSHTGDNPGVVPRKKVTPDTDKPLLISECNGHMFPTKSFDTWEKRQQHALRHARVQSDAAADGEHAGCFAWCMFDYATHKDFGSGDRICYHGVMDSFRNPKLAAAVYASQGERTPVLEIGSLMEIGDYPASRLGEVWAFTNADEVALYKNDEYVTSFRPKEYRGLKHGPIRIDDVVGGLLEKKEGFPRAKAEAVRSVLLAAGKYGPDHMPPAALLRAGECMLRWGMSYQDAYALYGKYLGNWGGKATLWRFDAVKDGKTVASVQRSMGSRLHLEVRTSRTILRERDTYDMAAVRIRVLDENGTPAAYAQLPLTLTLEGDAALVGPAAVTAEGGMCGTYVRTVGRPGSARLRIQGPGVESAEVEFTIGI
ncbi:MAG: glycoside hydrolase family 2 protein [Oscillospiraceae bacterium]|nr:glycoside hydrolase family 2 protein [Oscillospiraceae bacterium]